MKLKKIVIENFGVYEGVHEFDLKTNSKNKGSDQNLVIIKGPNGSGKSTFFRAVVLALFGRQALGSRISNREYEEYLLARFHKQRFADKSIKKQNVSIRLVLDYVESGKNHEITIHRYWERNGTKVTENLSLLKNDTPPDVQEVDYQTWLNDLFPPGLKTILSFDAEDMSSLIRAKNDEELKKVVKRLLGLHLVEQLEADLEYYLRNKGGGSKYNSLKDEILSKQKAIDEYNAQIKKLKNEIEENEGEEKDLTKDLKRYERELSSEGGDYAARRPLIKERIEQLDEEIEKYENKIREICTGLLPFALAPNLSQKLNKRLESELELHRKKITSEYLNEKIDVLSEKLSKSSIWKDFKLNSKQSKKMVQYLRESLEEEIEETGETKSLVHELAENDILKLQGWIQEVENSIPELGIHLSGELKEKKQEKAEHQEYLNRAPDDDKLEPLFDKIREAENRIREIRKESKKKTEELGSLQFKLEEVEREQDKLIDKLKDIEKESRKFSLAEKSQLALKSYHESLANDQLQKLCDELVTCFNRICEKNQLLSNAEIDTDTFEVTLTDKSNETMPVNDLSMGESQIYGLSLLWALRNISGYELPLLIDTPIARLDKNHRAAFIHEYLPKVSNQVLLFVTNAEMEKHIQDEFDPYIAHKYELSFKEELGSTTVIGKGYRQAEKIKA